MSWAIKTQKILVDYWHKSSEFLPGDKLQTVFFFPFLFSLFFPLACVTRRCWRDLKDWYFGRPITDNWVPSRQAALNKKKKKHSHTSTHVCHRPPETAAPRVSSRSHEERQCGWMWFRYWKKKKRCQRNGLPPDGCDKCQRDWFISWRLFRAPTTTTVINAAARDWCNCYAALMNWPRATMRPGAALFSHTWHRDPGDFAAVAASHSWKTELIPFIYLF